MNEPDDQVVYVVTGTSTRTGADGRPTSVRADIGKTSIEIVPMDSFKAGMSSFMNSVRTIASDIQQKAGEYEIDKLEIAASIGVDGKVSFLGSGVGVDTAASFTITLTKPGK